MNLVVYNKSGSYTGFLGNVLFQTAATIGIAVKNGMEFSFPHKSYYDSFCGKIPTGDCSNIIAQDYTEQNYHYDEVILNQGQNYNLKGYFQSERYWEHCVPLIKEMFTFAPLNLNEVSENSLLFYKASRFSITVSLHVRRGDYLALPEYHPILPMQYYIDAAKELLEQLDPRCSIKFIVFSNDFDWCKEHLSKEPIFADRLIFMEGNSAEVDLHFMSKCHHHIIANSSMSWWGSYLSEDENKIVYAPSKDKWYGEKYKDWKLDDLYRKDWKLI